ncbi:MAG: pimeloyl-ACP methyl ester carboxylesterase [Planctomycetota bacterium]|jgi:pimeloyl-ACP methyl ester carboxylesterase
MKSVRTAIPGLVLTDHHITVPLDHSDPKGASISVYAREVVHADAEGKDLPYLLFLQGGPGSPSPRPMGADGWVGELCTQFRVVLIDQRGTGLSSPIHTQDLEAMGDAQAQADYLGNFRMDSIVADCELLRVALQGKAGLWTLLGQSFGGFCSMHYLSVAPESLREVLITGGVPGLDTNIDDIYRLTYERMDEKNRAYYQRYPQDVERVKKLVAHISENEILLPCGSRLDVRFLQQLGMSFGMSDGFEAAHYIIESAFAYGNSVPRLQYGFLRAVQDFTHFDTNPLYALLHEGCYTQGSASNWSAARMQAEFPQFDPTADGPLFFTAEMIFPWMFEQHAALRGVAQTAELIAQKADWPMLYDPARLAENKVPIAAAVYHDDAYVPRELSLETAKRVPNMQTWVTNTYEHNGLRADGLRIVKRLLGMVRGTV